MLNDLKIEVGEVYVFTKSMNKVRTLEKIGSDEWQVERVDSKKKMIVLERALASCDILEEDN